MSAFLPCFAGLNNAEKKSLPSRKNAHVSCYGGIQWTPTKCDENEGKTVLLDLHSDNEAPINLTAVSLESKSAPLSDIKANNQLVLTSGNTG